MLPARTAVIVATGPSLTEEVIATARHGRDLGIWALYGMNHAWRVLPELDVFLACNPSYFDCEWERGLGDHPAEKWTWDRATADKYGIRYIAGKWAEGFSRDPTCIHFGHSSGFQLPQIAYHAGVRRMLLCGYDMRYAENYDGRNQRVGSSPRHFFGEYEPALQHWPSVKVKDGVHVELIEQFEKVKRLNPDVEIINCSPGSAMQCFRFSTLTECLTSFKG